MHSYIIHIDDETVKNNIVQYLVGLPKHTTRTDKLIMPHEHIYTLIFSSMLTNPRIGKY